MKIKYVSLIGMLFISSAISGENFLRDVKKMKWKIGKDDLEVVWVRDEKFPKFYASIYFQDGAISDPISGLTQTTFDLLTSGTIKQSQREISEFLDFYGVNLKHTVNHEYSVFNIQALTRDIEPVMGKVCEFFKDAQYPNDEINSHLSRARSRLNNLVTNHSNLADRVFRKISLEESYYSEPVDGTLESFKKINHDLLKSRLHDLRNTKKVLYLTGPSEILNLEKIIDKNCAWTNQRKTLTKSVNKPNEQSSIYLVDVPGANQAQIRIGRYMSLSEFESKYNHFYFLSHFLGGGFTSKLNQELRVKRGLTYSASAYVSMQRDYARAGLNTFSKNDTVSQTLSVIRDILTEVTNGNFEDSEFDHQKKHVIGAYAFGFEETSAFLSQLMLYDHQKRPKQHHY
jgi:zinc protease